MGVGFDMAGLVLSPRRCVRVVLVVLQVIRFSASPDLTSPQHATPFVIEYITRGTLPQRRARQYVYVGRRTRIHRDDPWSIQKSMELNGLRGRGSSLSVLASRSRTQSDPPMRQRFPIRYPVELESRPIRPTSSNPPQVRPWQSTRHAASTFGDSQQRQWPLKRLDGLRMRGGGDASAATVAASSPHDFAATGSPPDTFGPATFGPASAAAAATSPTPGNSTPGSEEKEYLLGRPPRRRRPPQPHEGDVIVPDHAPTILHALLALNGGNATGLYVRKVTSPRACARGSAGAGVGVGSGVCGEASAC